MNTWMASHTMPSMEEWFGELSVVAAVVVELANAACATVHWMVPRPPL